MRKIIIVLVLTFFSLTAISQDVIYLKNGDKLYSRIIEITIDLIKYRLSDDLDGPLRNIPIYNVYMIKYSDGKEEFFKTEEPALQRVEYPSEPKVDSYFSKRKNRYFSISPGIGQSYGGFGVRFQGRIGNKQGFGYHAGIGYMPEFEDYESAVFYSVGAKYFWYKAWYINLQYGSVGQYWKNYNGRYEYGTIYGPSFLVGGDWFFNSVIGINGAFGVAVNASQTDLEETSFVTFDLGFLFKF